VARLGVAPHASPHLRDTAPRPAAPRRANDAGAVVGQFQREARDGVSPPPTPPAPSPAPPDQPPTARASPPPGALPRRGERPLLIEDELQDQARGDGRGEGGDGGVDAGDLLHAGRVDGAAAPVVSLGANDGPLRLGNQRKQQAHIRTAEPAPLDACGSYPRRARHVRAKLEAEARRLAAAVSDLGGEVFLFECDHLDRAERAALDRARASLHEAWNALEALASSLDRPAGRRR
jgi:hypothetical protein